MTFVPAISLALASAVIACSPSPVLTPSQTDRVIVTTESGVLRSRDVTATSIVVKAPSEKVLVALVSAYADLGIEVKVYDPGAGQVGNRNFSSVHRFAGEAISKFVGCGQMLMGQAADNYRVTMALISQVTPHGAETNLETWLTATARDLGTSSTSASCVSTGRLETRLNDLVLQHVGG
jgi:hypothetical protein